MTAHMQHLSYANLARRLTFILPAALTLMVLAPATALAASSATTNPATKVHHTTVVLNGHLDPDSDPGIVECHFEWGPTATYGHTVPCSQGNDFAAPADVTADLASLVPGSIYHFRLDAQTTSSGSLQGTDRSFTTKLAGNEHPLIASFGSNGTSATSFGEVNMLAIDQAREKLYVFDRARKQIYGYNIAAPPAFPPAPGFSTIPLEGEYTFPPSPLAVDSSTSLGSSGNVYLGANVKKEFTDPGLLYGFKSSGTPLANFPVNPLVNPGPPLVTRSNSYIIGTAVAPNGEIWLSLNEQQPFFLRYSPSGTFLGSVDTSAAGVVNSKLVFDANGDLYASQGTTIWKFSAADGYATATKFALDVTNSGGIYSLAVDPSTHYVYATTTQGLAIFAPDGTRFDEIEGDFGEFGVEVNPADHGLYVAQGTKVRFYELGATAAPITATTAPAGPVGGVSATLNGFVDPEGTAVSVCKFEYLSAGFGNQSVPCAVNPGSGSGDVAVSTQLPALKPGVEYHYRLVAGNGSSTSQGEYETFTTNPLPAVGSPSVDNLTYNSADLKAVVNPRGFETTYRFEYGSTSAYGTVVPIPDGNVGSGSSDVPVSVHIAGLSSDSYYHWRIVAESTNGSATTPDQRFLTFGPVRAETVGSPIRTAATARLEGRVNPDGAPTTFHFEYGTEGPCDLYPCTVLPDRSAGSGETMELVSEPVEGLTPDTTYHYRVIAESPAPGSPSVGEDMTVTTRASDAPLSHGHLPGPVGSDRAYEQVSLPDLSGNPADSAIGISDDGERMLYRVAGANPVANTGDAFNQLFAERTANGWKTKDIFPARKDLVGSGWFFAYANDDLSSLASINNNHGTGLSALYGLSPSAPARQLFVPPLDPSEILTFSVSDDMSRIIWPNGGRLYDVSSGTPEEVDQLPDGTTPACGANQGFERATHWVSSDGDLVFFLSRGNVCSSAPQLYVRDVDAGLTKLISSPPVSGASCEASLIRSTHDAAFFSTQSRLTAADAAPTSCGGGDDGDIYRYNFADESTECLTCQASGVDADVSGRTDETIAVSEDGARVYFSSPNALIPGAGPGTYRLDVANGDLAFVAAGASVGTRTGLGKEISPDGSALIFTSGAPSLNALGGQQNGGMKQYYRYDDRNRSLVCLSCPQDGSAPTSEVNPLLVPDRFGTGPNITPISEDGETFAFATPTPLLNGDQNTSSPGQGPKAGTDIYEWRDGRLLLVTDGLTNWPVRLKNGLEEAQAPEVVGVSLSGKDIYFKAAAQYTPDALDGYARIYDARIGGGFEFPPPPKPCPLEVCQGIPRGAPEEAPPGSTSFTGSGNVKQKAHKAKKAHKKKQHKHKRRANHKRRAAR